MNELPTIKKRRAEKEPPRGQGDFDQRKQPLRPSHDNAGEFHGSDANGREEDIPGAGKLASTLKYEQRSGSSQCKLAWNVDTGKQQRSESVSDIHLQMMAPTDFPEVEPRCAWQDEMARKWESGGSARESGVKGRERWLPLQNAKDRLM